MTDDRIAQPPRTTTNKRGRSHSLTFVKYIRCKPNPDSEFDDIDDNSIHLTTGPVYTRTY